MHRQSLAPIGAILLTGVAAGLIGPAACAWPDRPRTTGPGVRNAHAMAYDPSIGRVVLFGGADAASVRGDTWAWDGDRQLWAPMAGSGPPPRTFPAMTFDGTRGEIVLFGGNRVLFGRDDEWDTLLGDTWVLRDGGWHRRDGHGPAPRAEAAMAYDRRRGRVVLFGGYVRTPGGRTRLGDTWEWDGERWEEKVASGPPPRNGGALAFDDRRGTLVLSGGPPASVTPEAWQWDGTTWRAFPPPHPSARFNPVMVSHDGIAALVRFGGWTGTERAADTWLLTGDGWHELTIPGPSPRNHSAMAYDARRQRIVLFGGHDGDRVFGDTWEFDGRQWVQVKRTPPQMRVDNGH